MTENKAIETFLKKPWIAYDGTDENGVRAEVLILSGYGRVESITASKNGNSFNVKFQTDNNEFGAAGWVPVGNPVLEKIQKAHEMGEPIWFRVEKRRKPELDRSVSLASLTPKGDMAAAKKNIVKSLVAVRFEETDEWTISDKIVTRIEDDPKENAAGMYSAYNDSTPAAAPQGSAPGASPSAGGFGLEKPPHFTYNSNGELNPGSFAVSVPLNIYSYVLDMLRERNIELPQAEQLKIVDVLLRAANDAQIAIYEGELAKPDLGAGSHTRARAIVFEVVRTFYPLDVDILDDKDALVKWKNDIVEKSVGMWKWSLKKVKNVLS